MEVLIPQHKNMKLLEQVYKGATKLIKGVEHLTRKDRLRKLGLLSLDQRRFFGDLTATFQYLKWLQGRLSVKNCSGRTKGMETNWKRGI